MAVRRESVLLELDDHFTRETLDAARAAKALDIALDDLDGSAVRTSRSIDKGTKSTKEYSLATAIADEKAARLKKTLRDQAKAAVDAESGIDALTRDTDRLSTSAVRGSSTIDRFSGRMGILLKVAGLLGPAMVPLGAVGIAGVAGLVSQLGFLTLGMSSLVIAAQGVGDAIKAVEKARLDPTIENIRAAREALEGLDPAAQAFVQRFQDLRPVLADIRNAAAAGFFPGVIDALDSFETMAPQIADIMQALGTTGGNLISDAAESLAGPEWAEFLDFVAREAPRAFDELGRTVGNVARGAAELWMAFTPLNQDFSSWMLDASRGFAAWADGLSQTEGFQEFVAYVRENGPLVADAAGAIANAILQIVQAAAPLAGPVLSALTEFANVVAAIADSPLGTPIMAAVTAMSALSLATSAATAATIRLNAAMATLGVTSKTTAASAAATTATGGASAAGASASMPAVLGGILAINNIKEYIQNTQALLQGEMEAWEYGLRGVVPLIGHLETLGIDILPQTNKGLRDLGSWSLDGLVFDVEDLAVGYDDLARGVGSLPPILERTERAMLAQERASARAARQAERTEARMLRQAEALRANQQAAQQAAEGFVDFGRVAKASEFTLDGWLDKLENQTDAMRRFRENAIKATENGLDPRFVQELRERGREGAVQLKHLADASVTEIARANRAWRSFMRESRAAGKSIGPVQAAFDRLGDSKAKPKIEVDGTAAALAAARAARAAVIAIPDKSHTDITESSGAKVAAAAARARAAVELIPETSKTSISENGAAETAAAAARARAAVLSIPTSRVVTISSHVVGKLGFAGGGYTGDGRKHEIAGIVHRGEVVLPQEIVKRDWPMLRSRYGHLPGMAEGGLAGARARASERRVAASFGGGTVRHVIEVEVVGGEFDLTKARAQIGGIAREVSRDEIDQDRTFAESQR